MFKVIFIYILNTIFTKKALLVEGFIIKVI
jgi:hypothetical protein